MSTSPAVERLSTDLSGVAVREVRVPEPAAGEVLVAIAAASVNYPDLLMARGESFSLMVSAQSFDSACFRSSGV